MINSMQLFVVTSLLISLNVASAEYLIKSHSIPSSLYHEFDDINDEIFPKDIRINVSISRMAGILLYSIDKNLNQLIVSLSDEKSNTLQVELNTVVMNISLSKLCGCEMCLYMALDLRIEIGYQIKIQCNGGRIKKFENIYKKIINKDYPIPFYSSNPQKRISNKAYLWLVNVDRFKDDIFQRKQMYGCIFNVSYNGRPILFKKISPGIENRCVQSCSEHLCNGGQCLETYDHKPLCDCVSVNMGGQFCTEYLTSPSAFHTFMKIPVYDMPDYFMDTEKLENQDPIYGHKFEHPYAKILKDIPVYFCLWTFEILKMIYLILEYLWYNYRTMVVITAFLVNIGFIVKPHKWSIWDTMEFKKIGIREISPGEYTNTRVVGNGKFGFVILAEMTDFNLVAVKKAITNVNRENNMRENTIIMHKLLHPRIIKLIGVCIKPNDGFYRIIMEFMTNGSLYYYLRNSEGQSLSETQQVQLMLQISEGMEYLESMKCIHRDLRTMNILLDDNFYPKIADFGTAKFSNEDYIIDMEGGLNGLWLAPEVWIQNKFSIKSDVWSFGVLMYEIVSRGRPLYEDYNSSEFLWNLRDGYRFPQEYEGMKICSDELYNIITLCWTQIAIERPSFVNIRETLEQF